MQSHVSIPRGVHALSTHHTHLVGIDKKALVSFCLVAPVV